MTVDGLVAMLEEQYGVELSMLSSGVTILYSDFMDRKKMKAIIVCTHLCVKCCLCQYDCVCVCDAFAPILGMLLCII